MEGTDLGNCKKGLDILFGNTVKHRLVRILFLLIVVLSILFSAKLIVFLQIGAFAMLIVLNQYFSNRDFPNNPIRKTIKESFYLNNHQKFWIDVLSYLIVLGLINSFYPCLAIKHVYLFCNNVFFDLYEVLDNKLPWQFIQYFHRYKLEDIDHALIFFIWDSIAIIMTGALTFIYYHDLFSKLDNTELWLINKTKTFHNWGTKLKIYCPVFLFLSWVSLVLAQYFLMVVFLCFVGIIFIIYDRWIIKNFASNLTVMKMAKFSLSYGDLPALIGLSCMLIIAFALSSDKTSGFIAGASAMHLIFGNIVVSISLGD